MYFIPGLLVAGDTQSKATIKRMLSNTNFAEILMGQKMTKYFPYKSGERLLTFSSKKYKVHYKIVYQSKTAQHCCEWWFVNISYNFLDLSSEIGL